MVIFVGFSVYHFHFGTCLHYLIMMLCYYEMWFQVFDILTRELYIVKRRFVWVYASFQFALVVLFAHIFYSVVRTLGTWISFMQLRCYFHFGVASIVAIGWHPSSSIYSSCNFYGVRCCDERYFYPSWVHQMEKKMASFVGAKSNSSDHTTRPIS